MKLDVKTDIDPAVILRERGLGDSREAQVFLAQMVANLSDPYVPMSPGSVHMKDEHTIAPNGSSITYHGPYAHYQYMGELMVGTTSGSAWAKNGEPKRGTGKPLHYHGAPMRGKAWDKRMLADRGDEIVEAFARKVGGKVK